ncbi:MAG: hypothetical protein JW832_14495 [Deltaproteobacteria bacterium]|nr:hypothetical protein [Deltaproteobacteria bacterium]
MKKHSLVILLLLAFVFTSKFAFAWSDNDTHPLITEKAAKESILGRDGATYLEDNLGFENGLDEIIFSGDKIRKLISDGARTEDTRTNRGRCGQIVQNMLPFPRVELRRQI